MPIPEETANGTDQPNVPRRVAAIFAHPDDAEFICAGTVAKWAAEGQHVTYVLMTSGDKGSDDPSMTSEQLVTMREGEQRAACKVLGVQDVIFLRHPDAMLQNTLELRKELVRVIRTIKPDAVITFDPTVRYVGGQYINHPDHRVTGDVTLDAIYPAARDRLTFHELITEEGLEPHKVSEVYLTGLDQADFWVDITDYFDLKLEALKAHTSQINVEEVGEWVREWATEAAANLNPGGKYAEGYRYFKLD
ncbi:MAG: PIG-L deacetylase family protein [Thermomicrobiales bacterium]